MNMEASLKERVDKDWMNAVTEDEGEELYNRIVGYPLGRTGGRVLFHE